MIQKDIKIQCRECGFTTDSASGLVFTEKIPHVNRQVDDDHKSGLCPSCGLRGRFRILLEKRTDSS